MTVDWVVLTAALVGLGLATMSVVSSGTQDLSEDIAEQLGTDMIKTSFVTDGINPDDVCGPDNLASGLAGYELHFDYAGSTAEAAANSYNTTAQTYSTKTDTELDGIIEWKQGQVDHHAAMAAFDKAYLDGENPDFATHPGIGMYGHTAESLEANYTNASSAQIQGWLSYNNAWHGIESGTLLLAQRARVGCTT